MLYLIQFVPTTPRQINVRLRHIFKLCNKDIFIALEGGKSKFFFYHTKCDNKEIECPSDMISLHLQIYYYLHFNLIFLKFQHLIIFSLSFQGRG